MFNSLVAIFYTKLKTKALKGIQSTDQGKSPSEMLTRTVSRIQGQGLGIHSWIQRCTRCKRMLWVNAFLMPNM